MSAAEAPGRAAAAGHRQPRSREATGCPCGHEGREFPAQGFPPLSGQRLCGGAVGVAQKFCDEIRRLLTACGSDPLQSLGILAFDCEQDAHLPFRIPAMLSM